MTVLNRIKSKIWKNQNQNIPRVPHKARAQITHVVIIDGTLSTLQSGFETNAGHAYLLIKSSMDQNTTVHYFAGIQFQSESFLSSFWAIISGNGINLQIKQAYGALASRYQIGDKIILMGYSRGAFAVRSLAGIIDRVGLLKRADATQRNVNAAFRYYKSNKRSEASVIFQQEKCHSEVHISAIGVWDTVKALGLPLPLLWRLFHTKYKFHNDQIGKIVSNGFHALALDETRRAFKPVMWTAPPEWAGVLEQRWFRGNHGDVGGQVASFPLSRPLANIPFVWMMQRLEGTGLFLKPNWKSEFPQDVSAPSTASRWSKIFSWLVRVRRTIGEYPSERIHCSVPISELDGLSDFYDHEDR